MNDAIKTTMSTEYSKRWYGIIENGRLRGGISNPDLYTYAQAHYEAKNAKLQKRALKVCKVDVTYRVVA
jgi:hypothetical protein